MQVELALDPRQRAADIQALMLLTEYVMREAEPDLSRLGPMVATLCAAESPEKLRKCSAMTWEQAVREMKIAFARHYLARGADRADGPANRSARRAAKAEKPRADRRHALPASVDEKIGRSLVAALLKFVSLRTIHPDWFAPHLEQMPLFEERRP